MKSNKRKLLIFSTLMFVFCIVIIALYCLVPVSNNKVDVVLKVYDVYFDTDGGNEISYVSVDEGGYVTQPESPIKEGYIFVGWTLNDELFDFSTEITGDMTLKAKWEYIEPDLTYYTIKFETDGGSTLSDYTIAEGRTPIVPFDPVKDGYIFKEWQLDGVKYDFSLPVTSDITLIAIWEKEPEDETVKYTVKFNSDGGSSIKSQKIKEGSKASKPSDPTKRGYSFKYWSLNDKQYEFSTPVTKDIELKAVWEKAYTVTFNLNGGSGSISSQSILEGGKASKPSNPTKPGYTFNGWYYNNKEYDFNSVVSRDIILIANWKVNTYTVKVYKHDGNQCKDYTVNYNSTFTIPSECAAGEKAGFLFLGYATSKNATSSNWTSGSTKVTANISVYPVYKAHVYTVGCEYNTDNTGNATTCSLYIMEDGKKINVDKIYVNGKSATTINIERGWKVVDSVTFDYGDLKSHTATK